MPDGIQFHGYPADHPGADLLRHKGLYAITAEPIPLSVLTSPDLVTVYLGRAERPAPLLYWLVDMEQPDA